MKHSLVSRALTGASAALLATTGIALGGPAHAASAQPVFSYSQGWRVDQHVRELADVNGDGRADVVGFGNTGVQIAFGQANGTFSTPRTSVRDFGAAQGWRNDRHVRTLADLDGDRRDDIVGFGNAGVYVAYSRGDGSFTTPALTVREYGWNQGWRIDRHPRQLADLNGNGTADIVGFGHSGVTISHGRTDRAVDGTGKRIDSFGWNRGWRVDKHPRLLADVDGNSTADIVGFGDAGTYVSSFSALGDTFTRPVLEIRDFGYAQGWRVDQHPRVLADVNVNPAGNAAADVIGFGHSGVSVAYSLNGGDYTGAAVRVNDFGRAQGWRGDRHLRTHADINVDGIQDLVGFGNAGVYVAHGRANNTFGPVYLKVAAFGWDDGWTEERYPRLLGDVNGDGRDDVVGFGHSATYVQLS
ncbi:VCBS repeat-containing protein [Kocuria sediminis]|uniref:VCBS repeat-containing protein n=1 Tax=Kocuria sediminis TaxID=1038857 RepID=A0A6N8GIA5_9MICC|nr:VCBS repeat-containing protein [Kocuria sediminis]MUN62831.1 VCBS repeat-containing protein [Kocuria sediminis]